MEHKPVVLTVLCEILRHKNVEFTPLHEKLIELSPSLSDDGDCRKLSYQMGNKRYSIKTGRFLTRRLRGVVDLTAMEVQQIAAEINLALHGEMIEVYVGNDIWTKYASLGIPSCMAHGTHCFGQTRDVPRETFDIYAKNPTVVSLAVCYTAKGAARMLVWRAHNSIGDPVTLFDRIYSDCEKAKLRIAEWAASRGYAPLYESLNTYTVRLDGEHGRYPYIDSLKYLNDDKTKLSNRVNEHTSWVARSTGGTLAAHIKTTASPRAGVPVPTAWVTPDHAGVDDDGYEYWMCQDCNEQVYEDDIHGNCAEQPVIMCEDCFQQHYVQCCCCDEWIEHHESINSENSDDYCRECYYETFTQCEDCECELYTEGGDCWYVEHEERTVCEYCYSNNYSECVECYAVYCNENMVQLEVDDNCEDCFCEECASKIAQCDKCERHSATCVELVDQSIVCEKCHPDGPENPKQMGFEFGGKYFETDTQYRHHATVCKIKDSKDGTIPDLRNMAHSLFGGDSWSTSADRRAWSKGLTLGHGGLEIMWPRDNGCMVVNGIKSERIVDSSGVRGNWTNYAMAYGAGSQQVNRVHGVLINTITS